MATTFGTRPENTVADSRGNVVSGVALVLYPTQADATAQTSTVATVTTNAAGLWPYSDASSRSGLWVRDPAGNVWPVEAAEAAAGLDGKAAKNAIVYRVADYASAQAAIDAAPASSVVLFPPGNSTVSVPLAITKAVTLKGSGSLTTRVVSIGCNAIEVAAGVTDVHIENMEVASAVRYTTTPNTLIGVKFDGTTSSHVANVVLRDVYIDGFQTAIWGNYLWGSTFSNVSTGFGLYGIDVYGKSVNNFVTGGCSIVVAIVAGSRGIRLTGNDGSAGGTAVGSEGWVISDSLIYGGEIGVELIGCPHVSIHDNIIDFNQQYGVRIRDNGTNFGGNTTIHDNYIAMTGAGGVAAIQSANTVSNAANTLNRIHHNHILVYSGSTCGWGLNQSGSNGLFIADGNTIKGFATADIYVQTTGNVILNNQCLTGMANAIVGTNGQTQIIANNSGAVYLPGGGTSPFAYQILGGKKVAVGIAAPTVNTWAVGDRVVNATPAVGSPKAWVCTVAGTPGTWVSEGNL